MSRDERVLNISDVKILLDTTRRLCLDLQVIKSAVVRLPGFGDESKNEAAPWILALIDNRITEMKSRVERYVERIDREGTPFVLSTSAKHELGVIYIDGKPV